MKINALIVDDEKNSRELLTNMLLQFCPEVTVVGESADIETAHKFITEKKPELVFLDIEMPCGNGFNLLKKYAPIPFSVIFITSYNNYAINAFKFGGVDYLLKPVEVHELREAVCKAISKKKEMNQCIINLIDNFDDCNPDKKISLQVHGNVRFIKTSFITHIEADGTYSNVYSGGEKFSSSKSLKEFEDYLSHNPFFIRINKSILINLQYLKEYSKGEPVMITLSTGSTFESSRRRKSDLLSRLKTLSLL